MAIACDLPRKCDIWLGRHEKTKVFTLFYCYFYILFCQQHSDYASQVVLQALNLVAISAVKFVEQFDTVRCYLLHNCLIFTPVR